MSPEGRGLAARAGGRAGWASPGVLSPPGCKPPACHVTSARPRHLPSPNACCKPNFSNCLVFSGLPDPGPPEQVVRARRGPRHPYLSPVPL